MKLAGLVLFTQYFEDYLSFLTEVLELELTELSATSMKLNLSSGFLEIKKIPVASEEHHTTVVFELDEEDFCDLVAKLSFFYYRHGPSRFLMKQNNSTFCELSDPDGRVWRFQLAETLKKFSSYTLQV